MHSPTNVNKTIVDTFPNNSLSNYAIQKLIVSTQKMLVNWKALKNSYLDFYTFTEAIHKFKCSSDGVHFLYHCGYRAIASQFDFNWMVSLGYIKEYTPSNETEEANKAKIDNYFSFFPFSSIWGN